MWQRDNSFQFDFGKHCSISDILNAGQAMIDIPQHLFNI